MNVEFCHTPGHTWTVRWHFLVAMDDTGVGVSSVTSYGTESNVLNDLLYSTHYKKMNRDMHENSTIFYSSLRFLNAAQWCSHRHRPKKTTSLAHPYIPHKKGSSFYSDIDLHTDTMSSPYIICVAFVAFTTGVLPVLGAGRQKFSLDLNWKFALNDAPSGGFGPACSANAWTKNLNDQQCDGLQQVGGAKDEDDCARACCNSATCEVYQWCNTTNCMPSAQDACWIGRITKCTNSKGMCLRPDTKVLYKPRCAAWFLSPAQNIVWMTKPSVFHGWF